jgi:hypothetical protein
MDQDEDGYWWDETPGHEGWRWSSVGPGPIVPSPSSPWIVGLGIWLLQLLLILIILAALWWLLVVPHETMSRPPHDPGIGCWDPPCYYQDPNIT